MKECPSCGASMPETVDQCPSCQMTFTGGSGSKQTLMGVPAEGAEGSESEADEGSDDGGRAAKSTQFGMPAVETGDDSEGEADEASASEEAREEKSTHFGVPAVDADEGSQEETEEPVSADEEDPTTADSSEEDVLSAWGLSSETTSGIEEEEEERHDTVEVDPAPDESSAGPDDRGPDKLKTMMGMPKVDESETEESDGSESRSSEEVEIGSMDELERQVRELEDQAEEGDEPEGSGLAESSDGAGVLRRSEGSEREDSQDGDGDGENAGLNSSSAASLGPGSYSDSSGSSKLQQGSDDDSTGKTESGGVLGASTYMESEAENDESGDDDAKSTSQGTGIPSPSDLGGSDSEPSETESSSGLGVPSPSAGSGPSASSDQTPSEESTASDNSEPERVDLSEPSSVPTPESQAPSEPETVGSSGSRDSDVPADSGLGGRGQGPTGFKVDDSDDDLAISEGVSEEGFGDRLEKGETLEEHSDPDAAPELSESDGVADGAFAEPDDEKTDEPEVSGAKTTVERQGGPPPAATPPPEDESADADDGGATAGGDAAVGQPEDAKSTVDRSPPDLQDSSEPDDSAPSADEETGPSTVERNVSGDEATDAPAGSTVEREIAETTDEPGPFADVEEDQGASFDEDIFEPVDDGPVSDDDEPLEPAGGVEFTEEDFEESGFGLDIDDGEGEGDTESPPVVDQSPPEIESSEADRETPAVESSASEPETPDIESSAPEPETSDIESSAPEPDGPADGFRSSDERESDASGETITGASQVGSPLQTASESDQENAPRESSSSSSAPAPVADDGPEDEASRYADLIQTVFGLLAGITFGLFVAVQLIVAGFGSEILLLSLTVGGGLATLVSFVVPFLPLDSGVQSVIHLGFGVVVASLAVAAMLSAGGLAVGPLIALFGSVFAIGAGLVQQAL